MKNILPLVYPSLTSYPIMANALSVLEVHPDEVEGWLADHFIQIISTRNDFRKYTTPADFYDNAQQYHIPSFKFYPNLEIFKLNRTLFLQNGQSFSSAVEQYINQGFYVRLCLNNFYLPCSRSYQKRHYMHPTFIYGYDSEQEKFYFCDFYRGGQYAFAEASYQEVIDSYQNHCIDERDLGWVSEVRFVRYRTSSYEFNLELLRTFLHDYLHECDSFQRFKFDYSYRELDIYYGLAVYDKLPLDREEDLDLRAYHVLYDQKTSLLQTVGYLHKHQLITDEQFEALTHDLEELRNEVKVMENFAIKYALSMQDKVFSKIEALCPLLKEKEYAVVSRLLDCIQP